MLNFLDKHQLLFAASLIAAVYLVIIVVCVSEVWVINLMKGMVN